MNTCPCNQPTPRSCRAPREPPKSAAVSFSVFEELESLPHFTAPRGRKTRSSSEDERGVSTEEIPLFVFSTVCLFLAAWLRASHLFTPLLQPLMPVSLLLAQRRIDI